MMLWGIQEEEYGHSGLSRILGGSGLAQAGWRAAGMEGAATPGPPPPPRQQCRVEQRRSAPSAGSCEEATEPGEAGSPLVAAAAARGGSPSLYLSASLAFSAAFQSPSGPRQPHFPLRACTPASSLLVACSRLRGGRGHLPLLLPPLPIRRKDYCCQHAESAHSGISLEKSGT